MKRLRKKYKQKPRYNRYEKKDDYIELILDDKFGNEKCRVKIDEEDLQKVRTGKWSHCSSNGYCIRYIEGKATILHSVILGKKKGYISDHINGDKLDNRKSNLRFATYQENNCNRAKMKGVYLSSYYKNKKQKKWVAHIIYKGKFKYLGLFDNESDALKVREEAEVKYFGKFRRI